MKRWIGLLAVLAVLAVTGTAMAWHGGCGMRDMMGNSMGRAQGAFFSGCPEMGGACGGSCGDGRCGSPRTDHPGKGPRWNDAPAQIRGTVQEMRKAQLQLQLLMMEDAVDEAKAREVFQRIQGFRNTLAEWRFGEMMKKRPPVGSNP